MRIAFSIISLALLTSCMAHTEPPEGAVGQRAAFERYHAEQMAFEQRLLVEVGFEPLASISASGRSVRQVLFQSSLVMAQTPGVEVERLRDGQVTVRVLGAGQSSPPLPLPPSAWQSLMNVEADIFEPRKYVPWTPARLDQAPSASVPLPPPPICHGGIARLGAAGPNVIGTSSWSECGGTEGAKRDFVVIMAELAVRTRPDCDFEQASPFQSFDSCFGGPPRATSTSGMAPQAR